MLNAIRATTVACLSHELPDALRATPVDLFVDTMPDVIRNMIPRRG